MIILLLFSFIGGVVTILSPCILPILPIILSSSVDTGKSRPYGIVMGFIGSFTFFTLFLTTIVQSTGISANSLRYFSVIVIALFGVSLVLPQAQKFIEIAFSKIQSKLNFNNSNKTGFGGGILIGLSLGLLWTPCVGPILASVISLALTGNVTSSAALITLAYSIGTAIPMFLIIRGGQQALKKTPWLLKNTHNIQRIFGVIMILTAIAISLNWDRSFQSYILQKFPQYGTGLTAIEDNEIVKNALESFGTSDNEMIGKPMNEIMDEDSYPNAPEIIPGGELFNYDKDSISITELNAENKVVLVDFWTYSCINCIRTLPYLKNWHEKYHDEGLVIIGVHSPEFEFEKSADNLSKAIADFEIEYPVVQDNNFATWRAYSNRYWPAKYLIDTDGNIRYTHFGEGEYDETEQMIQMLLKESGKQVTKTISNASYTTTQKRTPEIYLGYARMVGFAGNESVRPDIKFLYTNPESISLHKFAFIGNATVKSDYTVLSENSSIKLNFYARDVFAVLKNVMDSRVDVYLDGAHIQTIEVKEDKLYQLIELDNPGEHILEMIIKDGDVEIYSFTFG